MSVARRDAASVGDVEHELLRLFRDCYEFRRAHARPAAASADMSIGTLVETGPLDMLLLSLLEGLRELRHPARSRGVGLLGMTGHGKSFLLNALLRLTCVDEATYGRPPVVEDDFLRTCFEFGTDLHAALSTSAAVAADAENDDVMNEGDSQSSQPSPSSGLVRADSWSTTVAAAAAHATELRQREEAFVALLCGDDPQALGKALDANAFVLPQALHSAETALVMRIEHGARCELTPEAHTWKFLASEAEKALAALQAAYHDGGMEEVRLRCDNELPLLAQLLGRGNEVEGLADGSARRPGAVKLTELHSDVKLLLRRSVAAAKRAHTPTSAARLSVGSASGGASSSSPSPSPTTTPARCSLLVEREALRTQLGEINRQPMQQLVLEHARLALPADVLRFGVHLCDIPGTDDPKPLHRRATEQGMATLQTLVLVTNVWEVAGGNAFESSVYRIFSRHFEPRLVASLVERASTAAAAQEEADLLRAADDESGAAAVEAKAAEVAAAPAENSLLLVGNLENTRIFENGVPPFAHLEPDGGAARMKQWEERARKQLKKHLTRREGPLGTKAQEQLRSGDDKWNQLVNACVNRELKSMLTGSAMCVAPLAALKAHASGNEAALERSNMPRLLDHMQRVQRASQCAALDVAFPAVQLFDEYLEGIARHLPAFIEAVKRSRGRGMAQVLKKLSATGCGDWPPINWATNEAARALCPPSSFDGASAATSEVAPLVAQARLDLDAAVKEDETRFKDVELPALRQRLNTLLAIPGQAERACTNLTQNGLWPADGHDSRQLRDVWCQTIASCASDAFASASKELDVLCEVTTPCARRDRMK